MSKYTTGEIAKLCGVSVRTVQYYDSRNILTPSKLSEGGRRLYSEEDAERLKIICFLRELDLPINSIGALLSEAHPEKVISILLEEQEKALNKEVEEKKAKLYKLSELKKGLKQVEHFSVESIGDIAYVMENKKKLRRVHGIMLIAGGCMDVIEVGTAVLWMKTGNWLPFAIGICLAVAMAVWVSVFYFKRTAYICPQCHTVFKPTFKQAFFARHTPVARKLTCTDCGYDGFCVEVYGKAKKHG